MKSEVRFLVVVFGLFYFVQGVAEPTEGLISQPVSSLLRSWGRSATELGWFMMLIGLPWSLKPLYGLLSDFLPLGGYRRKSYLLLTSGVTALAMLLLGLVPLPSGSDNTLMLLLIPVGLGIAFSDVVIDALMVEKGQPLGITGRLQSVQWTMIWGATILTGFVGGVLSGHGQQQFAFLICAAITALTFFSSLWVSEPRRERNLTGLRSALATLWRSSHSPSLLAAAAFLFLWSFNPFSTGVLYMHMTEGLDFSEQFVGETKSVVAVASMLASLVYGFYCHRVPMPLLVHLSILLGVLSNLVYCLLADEFSALAISFIFGAINSTAVMIQLDLAARRCPPEVAGTMFALLMALSNLGSSLSAGLGGYWYDQWRIAWGLRPGFDALVAVGAVFTALCWLLAPLINRPERQGANGNS